MTVITFIQHDGSERMVDGDVGLSLMDSVKARYPASTQIAGVGPFVAVPLLC